MAVFEFEALGLDTVFAALNKDSPALGGGEERLVILGFPDRLEANPPGGAVVDEALGGQESGPDGHGAGVKLPGLVVSERISAVSPGGDIHVAEIRTEPPVIPIRRGAKNGEGLLQQSGLYHHRGSGVFEPAHHFIGVAELVFPNARHHLARQSVAPGPGALLHTRVGLIDKLARDLWDAMKIRAEVVLEQRGHRRAHMLLGIDPAAVDLQRPPLAEHLVNVTAVAVILLRGRVGNLNIIFAIEERLVLVCLPRGKDLPVASGRCGIALKVGHFCGGGQRAKIHAAQPRTGAALIAVHGVLGTGQHAIGNTIVLKFHNGGGGGVPARNRVIHRPFDRGPMTLEPLPIFADQVLAVGTHDEGALTVECGEGMDEAHGQHSLRPQIRRVFLAHRAADGREQPRVGLCIAPHMGGVAFAASVFPLAALPSIEEAVFRPVAGHGAEDGDLRADAVEQPVGEIRGVKRLVIQMGFFREHIQAVGDVAGHSQSVRPPVRIHVSKMVFR